jgi:hypothetical protein
MEDNEMGIEINGMSAFSYVVDELENENESQETTEKSVTQSDVQDSTNSKSEFQHYVEDYQDVIYGRKSIDDVDERSQKFIDGLLNSMTRVEGLECIHGQEDMVDGREIYSFYISDGKVHVQGGEGYEAKAAAYEKLLNASLKSAWKWSWNGRTVREEQVTEKLNEILPYYMDFDTKIQKADKTDSIVNHVGEAFAQWSADNRPKNIYFERRA